MDKSTIIARLQEHEIELKAAGIEHLFRTVPRHGGRLSAKYRMWMG